MPSKYLKEKGDVEGLGGDPNSIAQYVLNNIEGCINILQDHNVTMLDEEGPHTL